MFAKKTVADMLLSAALKKGKETFDNYNQKKENEAETTQPTSSAQNTNTGYGWVEQPSAGSGAGGYQQTTLTPITADALMTILKLHAKGVDTALIVEAVSTTEMRVSQKNVNDFVTSLKASGWSLDKEQGDIPS